MRTLIVSSNERKSVKREIAKRFELLEVYLPFDFLLYTRRGPVAAERKKMPSDFIASVTDGRFSKECAAMREQSKWCFIILEGRCHYRKGQLVVGSKVTNWTEKAVRNLKRSLELVECCHIIETKNTDETSIALEELAEYFDQQKHDSLRSRPGVDSNWPVPLKRERYLYWIQGLPEIQASRAELLAEKFPRPQDLFLASKEDIQQVKGLGHYLSNRVWEFLHEGEEWAVGTKSEM